MRHSKRHGTALYAIDNSCTICFAPTVLYVPYDMFLLVAMCLAPSSLYGQMGTTITSPLSWLPWQGPDTTFARRNKIHAVSCCVCFSCYVSSVGCMEVIAFALSSQWKTLIWCFCPMRPIQILAFVSSNVISNDCCCLTGAEQIYSCKLKCDCSVSGECTERGPLLRQVTVLTLWWWQSLSSELMFMFWIVSKNLDASAEERSKLFF